MLEQPFEPEPLADLLDTDPAELTEELDRLCERRILRIDGLRFRFRYDLVRQVLPGASRPLGNASCSIGSTASAPHDRRATRSQVG